MKVEQAKWLLLVLAVAGCSADGSKDGACGQGETLTGDDGGIACLYASELIEEGFSCPGELSSQWDLEGGGAVCAGGSELPPGVSRELEEMGYRPAENNGWEIIAPANNENNAEPNNVSNVGPNVDPGTNNATMNNNAMTVPTGDSVTFRIDLTTDVPEDYWAQTSDQRGFLGWVRLVDDRYSLNAPCDIGICGTDDRGGLCAPPQAEKFVDMAYGGEIEWVWDGVLRDNMPSSCYAEESAAAGLYTVEFCVGFTATELEGGDGRVVDNPMCMEIEFDHPNTPEVVWNAGFGG